MYLVFNILSLLKERTNLRLAGYEIINKIILSFGYLTHFYEIQYGTRETDSFELNSTQNVVVGEDRGGDSSLAHTLYSTVVFPIER